MKWSSVWPVRWLCAKRRPAFRVPSKARLAVEVLEDRVVPSTLTYDQWKQLTFKVDDAQVATVAPPIGPTALGSVPQNASFGSMIGLPSVFSNTPYRGDSYSVAIIDTGIDYRNGDLGGGFGPGHRVIAGWDFVNNDADPMDDNGHGTHVAGIIGSSSTTNSGIAPDVNFIALKVLDKTGSGSFGNVEAALQWVEANQAKYHIVAVNMSLGSGNYTANPYTFLEGDFSTLKSKGVFISVAAGNSYYNASGGTKGLDFPAISPNVVSVGAVYDGNFGPVGWASGARDNTTAVDRIASFSQRYSSLSIMAPGAMITSDWLGNTTKTMAGTSMATPVIAGAAVLIHQAMDAKGLTANQATILSVMQKTGVTVVDGDDENDNVNNTGLSFKRIDLAAALNSLGGNSNLPPALQTIANQTLAPGSTRTLSLSATDPEGKPITYSASILNGGASQAYQLKMQLGLTYAGSYFTNTWGKNEKWLSSTGATWYCLLPNGELRRWTGSMTSTLQPANLIATLPASVYADPSLLWNAQPASAPTLKVVGNQLTITTATTVASGAYTVQVTASDGAVMATTTFTLTIQANTAPQITALASRKLGANRSQTLTVNATDAQNDVIRYSARIVGTFAKPPATLLVSGNQLTIYTSPNFTGSFDVQVTASDGKLATTSTMHVTVPAATGIQRFSGDVNGDGRADTIFFNPDGSWWVSMPKADGSFVNQQWAKWSPATNWRLAQVGDLGGDGKTDIVGFSTAGTWCVGTSDGARFNTKVWATWSAASAYSMVQVGDFNGDHKTDILGFATSGAIYVGVNNGAAFATSQWGQIAAASFWIDVRAIDVDHDGKLDFAARTVSGTWYTGFSTGRAFRTPMTPSAKPPV